MNIGDMYRHIIATFKQAGFSCPDVEAAVFMEAALGLSRTGLVLASDLEIDDGDVEKIQHMVSRRLAYEPAAYITGIREFWSRSFYVTPSVLVPRPETEVLVEHVLDVKNQLPHGFFLDLGTGSGAILVTLLLEMDTRYGVGVDISSDALAVACKNSRKHGLDDRVQWVASSWFDGLVRKPVFSVITANPPYISHECMADLPSDVLFEPHLALDGGERGLESIEDIIEKCAAFLMPGGYFFMEIGEDQAEDVLDLLRCQVVTDGQSLFCETTVHLDYSGRPRVAMARRTATLF